MKWIETTLCLLFFVTVPICCGQATTIDLCKDNPTTLVGTKSTDYRINGLRLGLTHEQTWKILEGSNLLLGERDSSNPSRIYVYRRNNDGSKGASVLYLIWEPGEKGLGRITIFPDYCSSLSQNFRRLLSFEVLDSTSEFKRDFIGYPNRSKITLNLPQIDVKHTSYFYDEIGLAIIHKHNLNDEEVVFAIMQTTH